MLSFLTGLLGFTLHCRGFFVAGVVMEPVRGAVSGGVGGALKGFGKGLVGLAVKVTCTS